MASEKVPRFPLPHLFSSPCSISKTVQENHYIKKRKKEKNIISKLLKSLWEFMINFKAWQIKIHYYVHSSASFQIFSESDFALLIHTNDSTCI